MMFLGFILGGMTGIIFMALFSFNKISIAEEEKNNAEQRAVLHFRKLMGIDNTIKRDKNNHEYTIYTVRKIEEILKK